MSSWKIGGVLIVVAMMTAGTLHGQTASPEVAKVRDAYTKAVNSGDGKSIAGLYTEDAMEMPPNQPALKGRSAIGKYNTDFLAANTVKLSLTAIESMATGDAAYDVGTYSQTITPKQAGAKPMTDRGKYVVILRRGSDGQWRVKHAIYNSDLPPQPMPAPAKPAK